MELKTIKELVDKVNNGEIDKTKLSIILDNDNVSFYHGDEEADPKNFYEIRVAEAQGYSDILPLYKLLFPDSTVEWC